MKPYMQPGNLSGCFLYDLLKINREYVNAEKETAEKWGFKIEFFFGDCGGTYDYKSDEFNKLNAESYPEFVEKFGENRAERFYIEVENLLKEEK